MQRELLNRRRNRRTVRTRAKIFGTNDRPRLTIFRSNRFIYVQLVDDEAHKTLVQASSKEKSFALKKAKKMDHAVVVGELIAKRAIDKGIKQAIADRGSYRYHGRIQAIIEGARKSGLKL
jgi:large subunit ribosomal protein L18